MSASAAPFVLIVGEEEPLVDQFATWLRGSYRVETATDPQQVSDLPEDIQVVLLDQKFASTDASILRQTATRVGLILSFEPDWDVIEAGYDGYVTKPVTREEVHELVDRMVKRTQYEEEVESYFELVSERAAVTAGSIPDDLDERAESAMLEREIAGMQAELDGLLDSFDRQDYHALFRDMGENRD